MHLPSLIRGVVFTTVGAVLLSACTSPVLVDAAPYAHDPQCAEVMLAIPGELGGMDKARTSSQATAAYGSEPRVIVRCGVTPPGPTTDQCISFELTNSTVDWLVRETGESWEFVSFGRSPAVEVTIPRIRADEAAPELVQALSSAVTLASKDGLECR